MNNRQYYPFVDILRIVAMFGIVGCHLDLRMTHGAWLLNYYADVGVGVFGALAGYFYFISADGDEGLASYLRRRASRLLVPYCIWSLVFIVFSNVFHYVTCGTLDAELLQPSRLISVIFLGGATVHFWFLATLFYIQFILFPARASAIMRGPFALAVALALELAADIWREIPFVQYQIRLLGFFLIGAWMCKKRDGKPTALSFCLAAAVFLVGAISYPWLARFRYAGALLMVVPICWAVVQRSASVMTPASRRIQYFGGLMFSVYCVHPLITIFQREIIFRIFPDKQSALVFLADQFVAFVLSLLFAIILDRFLKKGNS